MKFEGALLRATTPESNARDVEKLLATDDGGGSERTRVVNLSLLTRQIITPTESPFCADTARAATRGQKKGRQTPSAKCRSQCGFGTPTHSALFDLKYLKC